MSEVERYQPPQGLLSGNPALVRLSQGSVVKAAKIIHDSGLWRTRQKVNGQWIDRPYSEAECWVIVMAGQSLGIPPVPAMTAFHLIEGRAEMSANLQAYFLKSSLKYDYRMQFHYDEETDSVKACEINVFDKVAGEQIGQSVFTKTMAQKAGLIRQGGNWDKYAESMLFARAVSNAVAWHAPDAVPMRIYGDNEIAAETRGELGVSPVEGEGPVDTSRVEAAVDAIAEEIIEDAEVFDPETEPPPPVVVPPAGGPVCEVCGGGPLWHKTEPGVYILDHLPGCSHYTTSPVAEDVRQVTPQEATAAGQAANEALDRHSPAAIETRIRADLPKLSEADRAEIKSLVTDTFELEWNYTNLVKCVVDAGFSDVYTWLAFKRTLLNEPSAPEVAPEAPAEVEPHPGVTGRQTGSQTAPTVSDAQVRMLHARFSACSFSEPEKRYFLKNYAQCESTRQVQARDVDDLLAVLSDIEGGDDTTRQAYLGGAVK